MSHAALWISWVSGPSSQGAYLWECPAIAGLPRYLCEVSISHTGDEYSMLRSLIHDKDNLTMLSGSQRGVAATLTQGTRYLHIAVHYVPRPGS